MRPLETLLVFSIAAALLYLAAIAASAITAAFRYGGRREESVDDLKTLSASRFTVPVSVLVALDETSEPTATTATIAALLNLTYPEYEVIVIAEGLQPQIWQGLKDTWALEAKEFFYRQSLPTAAVSKIYRSTRDPRLMIVDKVPAGRADAVNCGVNLARFRFVCPVPVGITFDAEALLRAMSAPMRDPAGIVAASSHIETRDDEPSAPSLSGALQRLHSIRSLMESRVIWRSLEGAVGPRESVVAWRRDALVQLGGFSSGASDVDLDMMVRLQAPQVGRVVRSTEIFGRMSTRPLSVCRAGAARRQRAALEAIWSRETWRGRTPLALAYLAMSELLTPCAQAWAVVATFIGALAGWFLWRDVLLVVVLLSVGRAVVSSAALVLRGSGADAPDEPMLRRLLVAGLADFVATGIGAVHFRIVGLFTSAKAAPRVGAAS